MRDEGDFWNPGGHKVRQGDKETGRRGDGETRGQGDEGTGRL